MWAVVVLAANALLLYAILNLLLNYGWRWFRAYSVALQASFRAVSRKEWQTAFCLALYGRPTEGMSEHFAELTMRTFALLGVVLYLMTLLYPNVVLVWKVASFASTMGLAAFVCLRMLERSEKLRRVILRPYGQYLSAVVYAIGWITYAVWGISLDDEASPPFWLSFMIFIVELSLFAFVAIAWSTLLRKYQVDSDPH